MLRRAYPSLLFTFALAAGCAGAAAPPAAAPEIAPPKATTAAAGAAPTPAGAPTSPGFPAAVAVRPVPAELSIPPAPAEAPAQLTRGFAKVTLPGVKEPLSDVAGRGPNDVWFVSSTTSLDGYRMQGGNVLRYDGKKVRSYGQPCQSVTTGGLVVAKTGVVALGYRPWARGVYPAVRIALDSAGKWGCDHHDQGYRAGFTEVGGDHVWQLTCDREDCSLQIVNGPQVNMPSSHPSPAVERDQENALPIVSGLAMAGEDDGWMIRLSAEDERWLFRYNGVTWSPEVALPGGLAVMNMWVDEGRQLWLLARDGGGEDDPGNLVLRLQGKTLAGIPVPKGFAARRMLFVNARDVWFLGQGSTVYQFDGHAIRQGAAPFAPVSGWASPDGQVWLVGGDEESGPGPGVAARTPPLPGTAPAATPRKG